MALKALSNYARFEILVQLADRPWFKAADVLAVSGLSDTAVTNNLIWLENNGLIECDLPKGERKGRRPNYRVVIPTLRAALLATLERFPEREWKPFEEIERPDPSFHDGISKTDHRRLKIVHSATPADE